MVKTEPKGQIKLVKKWCDKREIVKNQFYPDKFEIRYGIELSREGVCFSFKK